MDLFRDCFGGGFYSNAHELIHIISYNTCVNSVRTISYLHSAAIVQLLRHFLCVYLLCAALQRTMKTFGWLILKYCREFAHCLNKSDTVQYENLPCNMTINHKKRIISFNNTV